MIIYIYRISFHELEFFWLVYGRVDIFFKIYIYNKCGKSTGSRQHAT